MLVVSFTCKYPVAKIFPYEESSRICESALGVGPIATPGAAPGMFPTSIESSIV